MDSLFFSFLCFLVGWQIVQECFLNFLNIFIFRADLGEFWTKIRSKALGLHNRRLDWSDFFLFYVLL